MPLPIDGNFALLDWPTSADPRFRLTFPQPTRPLTTQAHQLFAAAPPFRTHGKPTLVPNQYVVTFNNSIADPQAEANRLGLAVPATVIAVYNTALKGCAVRLQPGDLAALESDPAVASVEPDRYRYPSQSVFPTGVSRIQYVTPLKRK